MTIIYDRNINVKKIQRVRFLSDNALYYFEEGKYVSLSDTNIYMENNTYYNKNRKFDPFSPIKTINNTAINPRNPTIIDIPEFSLTLTKDEEFYLYVPEDYHSPTVSFISYKGMTGAVMDSNNSLQINISHSKGKTIRLKYKYYESANGDFIRFIMCE